jgi:hypothetical protein
MKTIKIALLLIKICREQLINNKISSRPFGSLTIFDIDL